MLGQPNVPILDCRLRLGLIEWRGSHGYLYGYSDNGGLTCQMFATGEVVWAERTKIKKGRVSSADGQIYFREEVTGTLILLDASLTAYTEKSRFEQPDRAKENAWPHPTITNGELNIRDQDTLLFYNAKTPWPGPTPRLRLPPRFRAGWS
jgi:hypothetical protein